MTAGQELRINGTPVHRRLLSRLPELTSSVLESILRDVPFYRELPDEEVAGDIARVVEDNLRLVAALVRDRRVPDETELAAFAESAARRAEEGVPLEMVLHAYHVGAHEAWRVITQDMPPADVADMRTTTDLVMSYLRAAVAAVSGAYIAELRAMYRHQDEQEDGVGATIAARRKLRRAQVELDRFGDDSALSLLDPESGTVLLPETRGLEAMWGDLGLLVERMTEAAAVEVTAAAAQAAPDDVAAAVSQGREILDIVRLSRRPAGLYRLADVLLEYQLSRPTPARHALGALLDPLACNDDLLTTLRVHLTNELNRRRTARMLHIHPNTVDYRLRRIATLTGLDPALPSHLPVLVAAIAARRAEEGPA